MQIEFVVVAKKANEMVYFYRNEMCIYGNARCRTYADIIFIFFDNTG